MRELTGTWRLVRLALRRDRIKLPVWIVAIALMLATNIPAVISIYGKDAESKINYASTTAPSIASRIFGGPIAGPDVGEIILNETFLFTAVAIAFMSTLIIIRHTRQNEETGRAELIGSAVVCRHASLTAAMMVVLGANAVLGVLVVGVLLPADVSLHGALGMAGAFAAVGVCFGAVAALTAQLSESARGANSLAAMGIGIAFMLRAIGDGLGKLTPDKLGVTSAWPSWLSPIGWGQQLHPFIDNRWWIFGLFGVFFVAVTGLAYYYNAKRDIGLGLLPARKGPARAPKSLLSLVGLARRLQRGTLRGWAVAIVVMGASFGLISKEYANFFTDDPDLQAYLGNINTKHSFEDLFFAAMMGIMGIAISGYAVQSLQRLRSEETGGQLEPLVGTSITKPRWMLSHIGYTGFGVVVLCLLLGLSTGLSYFLITDASIAQAAKLVGAALLQIPAILVIGGVAVLVFGALPRAAVAVSWSVFAFCLFIGQFGQILKLPPFIAGLSPFSHIPGVPAEPFTLLPIAVLSAAAFLLLLSGLILFRRRDLTTA